MYADSTSGVSSGWQTRGSFTVGGGAAVTADSITPNAGSGLTQTFAAQYSDTLGATDLVTTWLWFNATFASSAANSCLLYYDRAANTLFLINNAGTGWLSAPLGAGTLENGSCAISPASSSAVPSGTALTLNVAVTFKPAFSGSKNIYMYAAGASAGNSGWQTRGTWTVP
jgi:hypothetical protein